MDTHLIRGMLQVTQNISKANSFSARTFDNCLHQDTLFVISKQSEHSIMTRSTKRKAFDASSDQANYYPTSTFDNAVCEDTLSVMSKTLPVMSKQSKYSIMTRPTKHKAFDASSDQANYYPASTFGNTEYQDTLPVMSKQSDHSIMTRSTKRKAFDASSDQANYYPASTFDNTVYQDTLPVMSKQSDHSIMTRSTKRKAFGASSDQANYYPASTFDNTEYQDALPVMSKQSGHSIVTRSTKRKAFDASFAPRSLAKQARASSVATEARTSRRFYDIVSNSCNVCLEEKNLNEFPMPGDLPIRCHHTMNVCRACIADSLAVKLNERSYERVGCPLCHRSWDRSFIVMYATSRDLQIYDDQSLMRTLETMPEFRHCLGPNCKSGQLHDGGSEEPIVTCNECGYQSCFDHLVKWHKGMTCEEYDNPKESTSQTKARTIQEENNLYEGNIGRKVKPCPGCKVPISKVDGCNHMTCE